MKKKYIQPSIEVVKIQTMGMLASSPMGASNETPTEWGAPEFTME